MDGVEFSNYGGNQVATINLKKIKIDRLFTLSNQPYFYGLIKISKQTPLKLDFLTSCTLFSLPSNGLNRAYSPELNLTVSAYASLQLENSPITLHAVRDPVMVLIAGTSHTQPKTLSAKITLAGNHYKVIKPWGHELWLNGEHKHYSMKEVMIRQGHRTSLQYHQFKKETNVLFSGHAQLIYKNDSSVDNDKVNPSHLSGIKLKPTSIVDVTPFILHRLEAQKDVFLYEVSTPHLDDVIRVHDDKERKNGRIAQEHVSI